MTRHSKIWVRGQWPSTPGSDELVLYAYSDIDDHLRLIALIGDHFEGDERADRDAARYCKTPQLSWSERIDAFDQLLRSLRDIDEVGYLVDPDALEPDSSPISMPGEARAVGEEGRTRRWDDAEFLGERSRMRDVLYEGIARGGWSVLRPLPDTATTERFEKFDSLEEEAGVDAEGGGGRYGDEFEDAVRMLPPAVERLARGLVMADAKTEISVIRHIRDVPDERRRLSIVELAYGVLTKPLARTARRLAVLRGPQQVNGTIGEFFPLASASEASPPGARELAREHVVELQRLGWLVESRRGLRMEASLRKFLLRRAQLADAEQLTRERSEISESLDTKGSVVQTLEAHHHAVMSANYERALETATYFGNDLRQIGVRLSHSGQRRKAAEVFKKIIDGFDQRDSYAWEYYGYNLARHASKLGRLEQWQEKILEAYEKACELSPKNPLYLGRLVGFHVTVGRDMEEVRESFDRRMGLYQRLGDDVAAGYFAVQVLDALRREGRTGQAKEFATDWHRLLRSNERIRENWLGD